MPKVFIIILNFNGWPDTLECLASLSKVNYDNFEVILIDNGSKENFQFPISNFQKFKIQAIYNRKNLGFAGGNNQGIKLALERGADYVLLLNNDTTGEPDFLTKLIKAGEQNNKYGILGPIIYDYNEPSKIQFAGGKINWSKTKGEHIVDGKNPPQPSLKGGSNSPPLGGVRGDLTETDYITGCCLLIKKEVIEKIGLMSEDYFLYYEDTDWNLRAQKAGWQCGVVPSAKVYHKASRSAQEFSYPYIYYHSRNGLIFASRFGSRFLTYLISAWIFLKQVIKLIIGYKRNWARPVMKGVIDFWRGKKGKLSGYY